MAVSFRQVPETMLHETGRRARGKKTPIQRLICGLICAGQSDRTTGLGADQPEIPQSTEHAGEMRSRRAIEPFEPILIEKRGEGRLAQLHLPQDAKQRSGSLVLLARE